MLIPYDAALLTDHSTTVFRRLPILARRVSRCLDPDQISQFLSAEASPLGCWHDDFIFR
jgi:hypothetical protein